MSVLISPVAELNQAPSAASALVSGSSGRLLVQLDASSQLAARGEGDLNNSPLKVSTFGAKFLRGIIPT
jgi:hypothetical protein